MDFRGKKWKAFFMTNGGLIYRILLIVGGIVGGILFYPKLIRSIYQYLTKYGFDQPNFISNFDQLTLSMINVLWVVMFVCMITHLILSNRSFKSRIMIYWCSTYFNILSSIGYIIAGTYFFFIPHFDVFYAGWIGSIVLVLVYHFVIRILYNRWNKGRFLGYLIKPMEVIKKEVIKENVSFHEMDEAISNEETKKD
ncbi:hypothetical protein [Listeria seeligeri]|uniref:hypothetical protein n=1 Tax=Listeria seeligeri TaxID=1640 RepID=UPI0018899691|nr:hypothetical protein [Listeria seeligeri]MBF2356046.1 hypothetical protein [Listeria seeligeri]